MEFVKKAIFMFFAGFFLGICWWIGGSAEDAPAGYYPRAGRVVEIYEDQNYFVVRDGVDLRWEVEDIEDFEVGDAVAMLMWDNNTPMSILDDEVMLCYYSRIDPPENQ